MRNGIGTGSYKYEPDRAEHDQVGLSVPAENQEASAVIAHRKVDKFAAVERDGSHRYVQKLATRLVQIVQTQRETEIRRTKLQSYGACTRVDRTEQRAILRQPKLGHRSYDKIKVQLSRCKLESWTADCLVD